MAKKKALQDLKNIPIHMRLTREALDEIEILSAIHGFKDNRSKYMELAARGLIVPDRKKAGLE